MDANAPKNQQLIEQYALKGILQENLPPLGRVIGNISLIDDLHIRVERADGNLLYRRANNVGLGKDESYLFTCDGKHANQIGKRGEYLFAINRYGKIIKRVNWPQDDDEERSMGHVYAWNALWKTKTGKGTFSNPIGDQVHSLVWLTIHTWHTNTGSLDRLGNFLTRTVEVVIYLAPKEGFEKLQAESSFQDHVFLDSRFLMRGIFEKDMELCSMSGRLDELCTTFDDNVYRNGMANVLNNGKCRGASGQFGPIKVLCAEMCGYDRVMLQDAMSWMSFQMRPGTKTLYVLGMGGTLPQLRNLVQTVVRLWNTDATMRNAFRSDEEVSVC